MALDREGIRRIAAGAGGAKSGPELVHLPALDEDVFIRRLERDERTEVSLWAGTQLGFTDEQLEALDGDSEDSIPPELGARMAMLVSIGALRYALVDGHGQHLIESFEEARGVYNGLDDEDWSVLSKAFGKLRVDFGVKDVDEGKASSGTTPESSPSTTSATSSGAGSPPS